MKRINNYTVYHLHTDFSLLDSCTDFKDYVDRAVELGQKAIAFTEHGKPLNWVSKKLYCDEKGIKYLHGVECYLTESLDEKVRDNYHTVLIAKNYDGLLEINKAISLSCQPDHFYYVNRMTFDEFLNLSDNVIKTSACLASPLNKLQITHPRYEELVKHYDYLEIQPHKDPDQIAFNISLATLAQEYNKPLIAGTDTHSLNSYKAECRKILTDAKRKSYDDDNFDLTYKSYDELVEMFRIQDAIPESLYLQAIENTNVMADSVESFELDTSFKYPILYGSREKDSEVFDKTIDKKFKEKLDNGIIPKDQEQGFIDNINEEKKVFRKIEMDGFMLSMSELISWCRENNIPTGPARGSVGGSRIAYVTDIIDLNPETWHTVFSRFCNEDRKEIGDIDIDIISTDRPKVFEYIIKRFGSDKTARVAAYGTIDSKGTIDEIGRALRYRWNKANGLKCDDKTKDNPYCYANVDKIKDEFASNEDKAKQKYRELFYYYDGLLGTRVSQSVHPAGMIISPITLADHYGVFEKDGDLCLMLDMDEAHEVSLVKYDFLILKNVQIIRDAFELAGKPYPRSHEIDWYDNAVWEDMIKSPVGIFQFEGEYAFSLLRQYKPKSIFDMSLVTACIRPSGASYRDQLIKHQPYKNPSPIIDELLKDNEGYLVYQEDTIKFLQQICGLSGSEADNVRRAIGRKDEERLKKALPSILDGYCNKSNKPRDIAEQEAKSFLQIIEDSASYQFGMNHSIAYCMVGYLCAYLRYYYPYEFITSYLNNAANDGDISDGTQLANERNIKILPPKYGTSRGTYGFDKEKKVISKGLSSVKFLNECIGNDLHSLSESYSTNYFVDLLFKIAHSTSVNSRQLDILLKIDFFSDFGNCQELLRINSIFDYFKQGDSKTIKKNGLPENIECILKKYATDKNAKGTELKSYTITDMTGLLHECEDTIRGMNLPDLNYKLKAAAQNEFLGYVDLTTGQEEDRRKLYILDLYELPDKFHGGVWKYKLKTKSVGSGKVASLSVAPATMRKLPVSKGDVIYAESLAKDRKGYWELYNYKILN